MELDPQFKGVQKHANREELAVPEVNIVVVTDLGAGNAGGIHAADLQNLRRGEITKAVVLPELRRQPTNRFRCIDGRFLVDGLFAPQGFADPGIAGGEGVTGAAADFMLDEYSPVSILFKQNVINVLDEGRPVVFHGDDHKKLEGCGAMGQLTTGEVFLANAVNKEVVLDKSWTVAGLVGLDDHIDESDASEMIDRGARKAANPAMLDATAEELVKLGLELGGEYEELVGPHLEKVAAVDLSNTVLDRFAFTQLYQMSDGKPIQVFVASIKIYADQVFADFKARGKSEADAARKVMAAILFNVGVSKQLTAEEEGAGEALPVVIVQ